MDSHTQINVEIVPIDCPKNGTNSTVVRFELYPVSSTTGKLALFKKTIRTMFFVPSPLIGMRPASSNILIWKTNPTSTYPEQTSSRLEIEVLLRFLQFLSVSLLSDSP